jgi:hypothetical protein
MQQLRALEQNHSCCRRQNVLSQTLAIYQAEAHGSRCRSDIHQVNRAFQLVMSGLMKEVADGGDCRSFTHEVSREPCSGLTEESHNRIQFLSSALKVSASNGEVSSVHASGSDKQNTILLIPEPVFRLRMRRCSDRRRYGSHQRGRHRRIRQRGGRNQFLRMYGRTKDGADEESSGCPSE